MIVGIPSVTTSLLIHLAEDFEEIWPNHGHGPIPMHGTNRDPPDPAEVESCLSILGLAEQKVKSVCPPTDKERLQEFL